MSLTLVTGPMFAGKSTYLHQIAYDALHHGDPAPTWLGPPHDTRPQGATTHGGIHTAGVHYETWPALVDRPGILLLLDEAHFLPTADLLAWITPLIMRRRIYVAALDLDAQGVPFETTGALACLADVVVKKTARCTACGRDATRTGVKAPLTQRFTPGAGELYQPLCKVCWRTVR